MIDAVLAIVTQDYLAQSSEEISLQKNRIITVLDQHVSEGWWKGDLNGKTGIFPADVSKITLFFSHLILIKYIYSTWNLLKRVKNQLMMIINPKV